MHPQRQIRESNSRTLARERNVLNVLIVCEESQAVCQAFRKLGHTAFSSDIQKCSGGHPEWHILGNCLDVINGSCSFVTEDGQQHCIKDEWDIVIGHPPCTYLSIASANKMFHPPGHVNQERYQKAMLAKEFFMQIFNCKCKYIAVENPTPLKIVGLPKPSCVIQPYEFGEKYCKRTLLWLKNLPILFPTLHVTEYKCWVQAHGGGMPANTPKMRAKTFPGIAKAMAEQWADYVIENQAREHEQQSK